MTTVDLRMPAPDNSSSGEMADEVERLHARIATELRNAGVHLPDAVVASIADVVLDDAIRLSLAWLEH
jgi:hypothetical protein